MKYVALAAAGYVAGYLYAKYGYIVKNWVSAQVAKLLGGA